MNVEYLEISEPLTLAVLALNFIGVLLAILIMMLLCQYQSFLEKSKANTAVSVTLLVSVAGCFSLSSLFMGKPIDLVCQVRVPLTLFFLTLCVICILDMTVQEIHELKGKTNFQQQSVLFFRIVFFLYLLYIILNHTSQGSL